MSQPAYDHRYSDRDVRENPDLRELAIDYINKYGGSFNPLLRIKLHLARGGSVDGLNTVQIRTILNCMRHDVAVAAHMPAPQFPYTPPREGEDPFRTYSPDPEARQVIELPRQRDPRKGKQDCGNPDSHEYHGLGTGTWCEGVPFGINRTRGTVRTQGRLKTMKFAATRSGALVHKLTGEARLLWRPYPHDWGFVDHPVGVIVKTNCKNPSWIQDGHLFMEEPVHLYIDEVFAKKRCQRCFSVAELREGPPSMKLSVPQAVFIPPEIQ